LRSPPL